MLASQFSVVAYHIVTLIVQRTKQIKTVQTEHNSSTRPSAPGTDELIFSCLAKPGGSTQECHQKSMRILWKGRELWLKERSDEESVVTQFHSARLPVDAICRYA